MPATTVDSSTGRPSRFLSLPREQRDLIIEDLEMVCVAPAGANTIANRRRASCARPVILRTLPPALRLVNHQFKQEVDAAIHSISHTVEFEASRTTRGPVEDFGNIVLHPGLPHVAEARIIYHVDYPCMLYPSILLVRIWTGRFLKANPRIKRVHVAMAFSWEEDEGLVWPKRPADALRAQLTYGDIVGIADLSPSEVQA